MAELKQKKKKGNYLDDLEILYKIEKEKKTGRYKVLMLVIAFMTSSTMRSVRVTQLP